MLRKINSSVLAFLLIAVMLIASSGCQNNAGSSEEKSTTSTVEPKEKPTVTYLMTRNGDGNFPEDCFITDQINERLDIVFKPILTMSADYDQKKSTIIASGDLPDIMHVSTLGEVKDYANSDIIIPLNDLLNEYGKDILNNTPEESWGPLTLDGEIYAVPSLYKWSVITALREDWLNKLNIGMETFDDYTLDDYYNILKRFKEEDPDGNGEDDTIGLAAGNKVTQMGLDNGFNHVFLSFGYMTGAWYEKDGIITQGALFPEMKGGLASFRKLYKEKILDPEFPIISTAKVLFEKLGSGKVGSFYHNWALIQSVHPVQYNLNENVPGARFVAVYPPKGPEGKRGNQILTPQDYMRICVITNKSKNPDAAMRYMNFTSTEEGHCLLHFGIEGEHYNWEDNSVVFINEATDGQKRIQLGLGAFMFPGNINLQNATADSNGRKALDIGYEYGTYGINFFEPAPSSKEYEQALFDIINEHYVKMIIEDEDLDEMFNDFTKTYMQNGGEILGKELYEIYKNMNSN